MPVAGLNQPPDVAVAELHWRCVAICIDYRRYGLKAIERHRLNAFIACHREKRRIPKTQLYAVMQIIAVCEARRKTLPPDPKASTVRRRAGRKRAAVTSPRDGETRR